MTRLYLVDAFTSKAFSGNPAGVCVMEGPGEDSWMQQAAAELNVAETAFLFPQGEHYVLRWFTPLTEVDLCGHATLAASHILWEQGYLPLYEPARFFTRSGLLSATFDEDWITMDFPAEPAVETGIPPGLAEALGATPVFVGKNRFDYLVELESAKIVSGLTPNLPELARLPARGIIVTAGSQGTGYDFVSRFFAPAVGIPEDQVTGSAHCCLAPYWGEKLKLDRMTGYQASRRGGIVRVAVRGSRVDLSGQAVTVIIGDLIPPVM
jgi:PhzF family phenazine biosynthesis protein